jgi:hypothetical protein
MTVPVSQADESAIANWRIRLKCDVQSARRANRVVVQFKRTGVQDYFLRQAKQARDSSMRAARNDQLCIALLQVAA